MTLDVEIYGRNMETTDRINDYVSNLLAVHLIDTSHRSRSVGRVSFYVQKNARMTLLRQ